MSIAKGFNDVRLDERLRQLPMGTHEATLVYAQEHETESSGPGLLVCVSVGDIEYGWRIAVSVKYPKYGQRKIKSLIAAVLGRDSDGSDITTRELENFVSPKSPYTGRRFRVSVAKQLDKEGNPAVDKFGRAYYDYSYERVESAEPEAPAPAPLPPALPGKKSRIPEGWTQHPKDPDYYFSGTEVKHKDEF